MRGDAFIHFVCGSRRVNIRLGVLLLIPKSPHISSSPAAFLFKIFLSTESNSSCVYFWNLLEFENLS